MRCGDLGFDDLIHVFDADAAVLPMEALSPTAIAAKDDLLDLASLPPLSLPHPDLPHAASRAWRRGAGVWPRPQPPPCCCRRAQVVATADVDDQGGGACGARWRSGWRARLAARSGSRAVKLRKELMTDYGRLIYNMQREKGSPLPKFGEWDVNDPASAEGFMVIFNKARDEKKTGGNSQGQDVPTKSEQPSRQGLYAAKGNSSKKWFCCLQPTAAES